MNNFWVGWIEFFLLSFSFLGISCSYFFCICTSPRKTWCSGFWLSLITNPPYQFLLADGNSWYPSCGTACKTVKPAELAGLYRDAHLVFYKDVSHQLESNALSCSSPHSCACCQLCGSSLLQPRMWTSDGKKTTFKTQTVLCRESTILPEVSLVWGVCGA